MLRNWCQKFLEFNLWIKELPHMLKDIVIQLALRTWWQKYLMFAYLSKRYFELMENQLHFHKVVFALFQEKSNLQFASSNCKCNTWPFLVRANHYESNVNTIT